MSAVYSITALILAIFTTATKAALATTKDYDFKIFTCGALGGSYARELTSFFIAEKSEKYNFLSMDAGTSLDCIDVAAEKFAAKVDSASTAMAKSPLFDYAKQSTLEFGLKGAAIPKGEPLGLTGYFRKKQLNGFLVTHAHSDHQTGLVISSAEDDFQQSRKPVIASKNTVAGLKTQLNPPLWPGNFFYRLIEHNPADGEKSLNAMAAAHVGKPSPPENKLAINHWAKSKFWITPYFLSHDTGGSTAYRICNGPVVSATACVLFFGDTGPDDDELNGPVPFPPKTAPKKTKKEDWLKPKVRAYEAAAANAGVPKADKWAFLPLRHVWDENWQYMQSGVLNTIFIECSYSDERIKKDKKGLFGHLTPALIMDELAYIGEKFSGTKNTVPITVAVMHLKPTWNVKKAVKTATSTPKKTAKTATDGLTALIRKLKVQFVTGASKKKYRKKTTSVNDLVNVRFIWPQSEDMIYVKAKADALYWQPKHADTFSVMPKTIEKDRGTAPRGDYDYNGGYHTNGHNHHNEGYGLFATEIVLVLALVCVVGLCFVVGLTFGGGVMWMAMIKKRKEKRTN